jgi:hypothetical protein
MTSPPAPLHGEGSPFPIAVSARRYRLPPRNQPDATMTPKREYAALQFVLPAAAA